MWAERRVVNVKPVGTYIYHWALKVHFWVAQSLGCLCTIRWTADLPMRALLEQPIKCDARRGYFLKLSLEKQGEEGGVGGVCKMVHKFQNGLYSCVSKHWLFWRRSFLHQRQTSRAVTSQDMSNFPKHTLNLVATCVSLNLLFHFFLIFTVVPYILVLSQLYRASWYYQSLLFTNWRTIELL